MIAWMHMVDAAHGYAVRGVYPAYHFVVTADAGHTWNDVTPVRPSSTATVAGKTVVFGTQLGPSTFAVERSDDGGRTWRMSQPFRDSHPGGIGAPDVVDSKHLYVAIGEGAAAGSEAESLWASSDGGRTWRFVSRTGFATTRPGQLPFGCDKDGYGFVTPSVGWATGFCAGGRPFIYRTTNGGLSWKEASLPGLRSCQCDVSPPAFFGDKDGVIVVTGSTTRVYWTSDGGSTWRLSVPPTPGVVGVTSVASPSTVWLAARDRLVRTADAGRTWRTATLPFDTSSYPLDAVSATTAFAYGPSVLETTDGGAHWQGLRAEPACPLQQPNAAHGTSTELVPRNAATVVLCRYGGLNTKGAVGGLVASARVRGYTVSGLVSKLDALPQMPKLISCPLDDGSSIDARLGSSTVRIGLTGCNAVTNGHVTRRATPALLRQVERILVPKAAFRPCAPTQLGVSVKTGGENTTAWIGITVQNLGAPCVAKNVPVTVELEHKRLMLHMSATLDHGGTQSFIANWGNWCGSRVGVSVTVEAGAAADVEPVRPLPLCLQRGQPSRLSAVH